MAEIQSQPEANGLPHKFGSTSDNTTIDHTAANISATMSNAGADSQPDLSSSVAEPVKSMEKPSSPSMEVAPVQDEIPPTTNGNSHISTDVVASQVNGHAPTAGEKDGVSDSQPAPAPAPALLVESSFPDSVVPSSITSEIPSSNAATDASTLQPVITPEQAPTSDLRTTPHSDHLSPEKVAIIEQRKHDEDNNADKIVSPIDQSTVSGLPSPPAQASQPAPLSETTPEQPVAAEASVEDTVMQDASVVPTSEAMSVDTTPQQTKVAREREEDTDEAEPTAKRLKTEEPQPAAAAESATGQAEFKVPEPPSATSAATATTATVATPAEVSAPPLKIEGDDAVTPSRLAHMKKVISNLKKSKASTAFRLPVDYVTLNIPTYPDIVKSPMDLGTIDTKLKKNEYTSIRNFVLDFELIVNNCVLFNGREHAVTQAAQTMQSSFNNQMANLPSANEIEPSKAEKKAMKLKTEPIRSAPPRRPSVTTPGSARSPKSTVTATTPSFAPGPDGIPLIRRDSNMVDGRPKRAIVPPKRNSDFSGARPKKKKYELQLRFCQEVLKEIASPKHWQLNQYFTHAVDPVALNIPTYFQVIKKPMDLGTVQNKLDNNVYEKAKDFEEDVRLIFKNCYKFNPDNDYINQVGHQLEELFDRRWAQKDDWIAAREPQSDPQSEGEEEEEEEGSEEEEADSEDDRNEKIKLLQAQIEAMSKQMGELTQSKKKKKVTPPTDKKKSKSKPKKEKASAQFPGLSKAKDKKKPSTKSKAEKDRYVTFQEKQYISNGIAMLPERQMQEALKIIQSSVPALANSNENEIELDIEEVPNHALLKLLSFVKKFAPMPPDENESSAKPENYSSGPTKSKKNKPMSKQEQEAQIEELRGRLGEYAGPVSPNAMQSVETGNDSSDDSADSEESEEE